MTHLHILASDTVGPAVAVLFLAPIFVALGFMVYLAFQRGRAARDAGTAPRSRWGLIIALVPTAFGALMLLFLLTVRGGAPRFFYIVAMLPLLVGVKLLRVWARPDRL